MVLMDSVFISISECNRLMIIKYLFFELSINYQQSIQNFFLNPY